VTDQLTRVDIRDFWENIRPGLEHTKLKIGAPWRPEDVYAACLAETAFVYSGETGFVVVQPKTDTFNGKPELFVWIAFAYEGQNNIKRFQAAVDQLARENNYPKLTMQTTRPGFERIPGWTQVSAVYERVL
jgi:hypothetical protein